MAYFELENPFRPQWEMTALIALNARKIAGDKRAKIHMFMPDFDNEPDGVKETKKLATMLPGMPDHIASRFEDKFESSKEEQ
jgi:hypothetical protein